MNLLRIWFLSVLIWLSYSHICIAGHLKIEDVYKSVIEHYPKIREQQENIKASVAKANSSLGFSDYVLEADTYQRLDGYYTGKSGKIGLKKSLLPLNANIQGGYRISGGSFPVYESQRETLPAGELFGEFSFDLLKDRTLDPQRLELKTAKVLVNQSQSISIGVQQEALIEAAKAYWYWVANHYKLQVTSNLLAISEKRQKGLEERSKKGDIAQLTVDENVQYLLQRKAKVIEQEQNLIAASEKLSLFYRDQAGLPQKVVAHIPINMEAQRILLPTRAKSAWFKDFPEIKIIESQMEIVQQELDQATQSLLPRLNLGLGVKRDLGDTPKPLAETELYGFGLFSFPLQNRKARGNEMMLTAKKNALQMKMQLLQESLHANETILWSEIENQKRIFENEKAAAELADKLEEAERIKWEEGDSDFFIVNLREQNAAYAQMSKIQSYAQVQTEIEQYRIFTNLPSFVAQL